MAVDWTGLTTFFTANWDYLVVMAVFLFVLALAGIAKEVYLTKK